jgi:hypothetical protein
MRRDELHKLLDDLADAPGPKVTITLPTHRQDPNGERDRIRLKNLVKQAIHDLEAHAGDRDEYQRLHDQLESLSGPIDHRQLDHGMAIFAAPDELRTVHLSHTPIERALVAERFATRELHRDVSEATSAWILALSTGGNDTDGTQLFHLHRGELDEHRDDVLPADWDIRDRDTRFSEVRPDSPQRDAYIEDFLRRAEEHVAGIVGTDPIVLAGIDRLRSHYHAVTKLGNQIVAEVDGNFDNTPGHVLAQAAEEALVEAHARELEAVAAQIDEQAATSSVATGIDDCERLTAEGRVAQLVLERSYLEPVLVDDVPIGDRAEVAIRQAHEHGGQILAVEDGRLEPHLRIAAMLRW